MVSKQPGTMDLGVIDARRKSNNALTRNQRRKNSKPRKQAPTQGQGSQPRITMPAQNIPTPNRSLDERVMRMREQVQAPSPAEEPEQNYLPPFDDLDRHTKGQIRGFILREFVRHPDLMEALESGS